MFSNTVLLSPRNSIGGDIVMWLFMGGWVSEWLGACVRPSGFTLWTLLHCLVFVSIMEVLMTLPLLTNMGKVRQGNNKVLC